MQHNYNTELNSLSNLLYECSIASSWFDDIDGQLNIIKSNGFNKDIIRNDIKNKYLVYFHIDPNNNTGISIYITKLTGEIRHGSNGFIGAILLEQKLIEHIGISINNFAINGFKTYEDVRALFHLNKSWLTYNFCSSKYYLRTKVFDNLNDAKTYAKYLNKKWFLL